MLCGCFAPPLYGMVCCLDQLEDVRHALMGVAGFLVAPLLYLPCAYFRVDLSDWLPLPKTLELTLPDQAPLSEVVVQADPARLRQVLLDLIENADKYSAPGRPIRLALRSADGMACIDVIDQGIGIPPDELDRVFERFQRGSNAPEKTGSGLGLSVVQLLVEGMGGSIEVCSRLDEGSCFTVLLPQ